MSIKVIANATETTFVVDGLKGSAYIRNQGDEIMASEDHITFLPLGATQDKSYPTCHSIRNPTQKQVSEFLHRIASA